MKWPYEQLRQAWTDLLAEYPSLDDFCPRRDALMAQAGWTTGEFHLAMDRKDLEMCRSALKRHFSADS